MTGQGKAIEVVKAVPAPVPPAFVRDVIAAAAGEPSVAARLQSGWSMSVRISGDRELRRLNRTFLGEDHATDVLSFPADEPPYLGDVVVSWPAVQRQATEFGHTAETELALLCVHGLLHLLGWDHAEPAAEASMTRLTLAALARSGLTLGPARGLAEKGAEPGGDPGEPSSARRSRAKRRRRASQRSHSTIREREAQAPTPRSADRAPDGRRRLN